MPPTHPPTFTPQEILAAEQRNKVFSKLHTILKPFVLRRLKSDVDTDLPCKAEVLLYVHMTKVQKALNKKLLDGTLNVCGGGGGGGREVTMHSPCHPVFSCHPSTSPWWQGSLPPSPLPPRTAWRHWPSARAPVAPSLRAS